MVNETELWKSFRKFFSIAIANREHAKQCCYCYTILHIGRKPIPFIWVLVTLDTDSYIVCVKDRYCILYVFTLYWVRLYTHSPVRLPVNNRMHSSSFLKFKFKYLLCILCILHHTLHSTHILINIQIKKTYFLRMNSMLCGGVLPLSIHSPR